MSNAPFPIQPELTAMAIGYRNQRYIADQVLPRMRIGRQEFKYLLHTTAEAFTIPDTKVGRKSQPNEVEFTATEATGSTTDYGLEAPIPFADIENRPPNFDPEGLAVIRTTDLVLLDREKRVADAVFNASNYAAANKATLSGSSQWSDTTSDPFTAIMTAFDGLLVRPNKAVMGRAVFSKLRQHPKILEAVKSTGGAISSGVVAARQLAELLELDELIVGESWLNTAKKGQTASMARAWGKSFLAFYQNPLTAAPDDGLVNFGVTAQWGDRIATRREDPNIGLRGGIRLRVGESTKELITCADAAFLWSAAVA